MQHLKSNPAVPGNKIKFRILQTIAKDTSLLFSDKQKLRLEVLNSKNKLIAFVRVIPLLLFLLTFGISASEGLIPADFRDTIEKSAHAGGESTLSPFSTEFIAVAMATEKTVNIVTFFPPSSSSNNPVSGILSLIDGTGTLFLAKFKQYNKLFRTFHLRDRKADFLFPFHYFW